MIPEFSAAGRMALRGAVLSPLHGFKSEAAYTAQAGELWVYGGSHLWIFT